MLELLTIELTGGEVASVDDLDSRPTTKSKTSLSPLKHSPAGILFFDLETVPDPKQVEIYERLYASPVDYRDVTPESIEKTPVAAFKQMTATASEDSLLAIMADDKRKGVKDACRSELKKRQPDLKKYSTTPELCRIVAMAYQLGEQPIEVVTAADDLQEVELITLYANLCSASEKQCGFNILHFDTAVLMARAALLGVSTFASLRDRDRIVDLQLARYGRSMSGVMGLKTLCQLYDIEPESDCDGSEVLELYNKGDMDAIAEYCKSDVDLLVRLWDRWVGTWV